MKNGTKVFFLIFLHLLILIGLFTFRNPLKETFEKRTEWDQGTFKGNITDYGKLYFSGIVEAYYFEWSTLVLGKNFPKDYPFSKRVYGELGDTLKEKPKIHLPYRDVPFEYPPLLIAPILVARLMGSDFLGFLKSLAFLISIAYLGSLWVTYEIWKKLRAEERLSWPKILSLSALSLLALGQLFVNRLDVFPTLLLLLALNALIGRSFYRCSIWIVLGTLTKAFSILLAPLLGLVLLYEKKYRKLILCVILVVGLLGSVNFALGWLTHGGYWDSYRFHSSRGIQIESLYALIPYLSNLIFHTPITIYESHNSINIKMENMSGIMLLSYILPFLVLIFLYGFFWRSLRNFTKSPNYLIEPSLLLVFAFLLTFKVLSPQFLIWLIPLIFICGVQRKGAFFSLFIFLLFLTQMIWPNFYFLLEEGHVAGVLLLLLRNLGLLFLFCWIFRDWCRQIKSMESPIEPCQTA